VTDLFFALTFQNLYTLETLTEPSLCYCYNPSDSHHKSVSKYSYPCTHLETWLIFLGGPESLGSTLLTGAAPAAVSSAKGRLDVFGPGQNNDLLHWSFDGSWTGPESLDPGRWRSL